MQIVLVGMPASGKSTLGKQLAQKLQFPFIDLDALICEQAGCSIPDIFAQGGEEAFRQAEQNALHGALKQANLVLATGGGTPCFFDNMQIINQTALSIYLQVPLKVLAQRIQAQKDSIRPLYSHLDESALILKLQKIFEQRSPFYQQAQLSLSETNF